RNTPGDKRNDARGKRRSFPYAESPVLSGYDGNSSLLGPSFSGGRAFGGHAFVGQGIREGAGRKISPDVPAAAWVSGAFRTGAFVGIFWREGRNLKLFRWAGIS